MTLLCMFSPKGMTLERGWPGRIEGDRVIQLAAQTIQVYFTAGGALRDHAEYPLAEVDLRAPVLYPPCVRLFDEEGLDFAFGNAAAVYGPEDEITWPDGASELRTGPAVAAVIGDRKTVERIVQDAIGEPPRELRFLRTDTGLVAFLTLGLDANSRLDDAHARASEIEERIRRERPDIADVIVHTEP